MKKMLMAMAAIVLLASGCNKATKYDCVNEVLALIESYTEQVEKCENAAELTELSMKSQAAFEGIGEKYAESVKQFEADAAAGVPEAQEAQEKLMEAMQDFLQACVKASERLGDDAAGELEELGEDVADDLEEVAEDAADELEEALDLDL